MCLWKIISVSHMARGCVFKKINIISEKHTLIYYCMKWYMPRVCYLIQACLFIKRQNEIHRIVHSCSCVMDTWGTLYFFLFLFVWNFHNKNFNIKNRKEELLPKSLLYKSTRVLTAKADKDDTPIRKLIGQSHWWTHTQKSWIKSKWNISQFSSVLYINIM